MNNVAYALYMNLWLFLGLITYFKTGGDWIIGFGTISVGVLICYTLDDIVMLFTKTL